MPSSTALRRTAIAVRSPRSKAVATVAYGRSLELVEFEKSTCFQSLQSLYRFCITGLSWDAFGGGPCRKRHDVVHYRSEILHIAAKGTR
jgi:hypothetical protein